MHFYVYSLVCFRSEVLFAVCGGFFDNVTADSASWYVNEYEICLNCEA